MKANNEERITIKIILMPFFLFFVRSFVCLFMFFCPVKQILLDFFLIRRKYGLTPSIRFISILGS